MNPSLTNREPLPGMRCIRVLIIALFAFSLTGSSIEAAQPVTAAQARDVRGCEDGVGSTYLHEELSAALENDTFETFRARREACGPHNVLSYTLGAICTGAEPLSDGESVAIYCSVQVWNPSDDFIELTNDQFTLSSNNARYEVSEGLLVNVVPDDTLLSGKRVYPSDLDGGVLGFQMPMDQAGAEFVLVWHVPNAETSSVSTWKRLQILLGDRDAVFEERPDSAQAIETDGSLTLSGESDTVSDPVELAAGIYRVQAQYRGDSNFAVWVRMANGDSDLLFNEIDSYSGEATFQVDASTTVLFEVTGIGSWEIIVTPAFG
ncbi:MAG: hypothetical protein M3Z20_18835 [Chloroflexota bacterium]|nr:hypothetical protein [Chloroflexota bacterium]